MVLLESNQLNYGDSMKSFNLPNVVNGKKVSNKDLTKELAVVAFICNHCPYVVRIIDQFSSLAKHVQDSVDFISISANDPDYREEDSPENMITFAKRHKFIFPYLFDESQAVAKAFGAVCTPDIFVYKRMQGEYKLAYHARFEDLEKALRDLSSKDEVSFEQLPSAGCSIKWK